MIDTSENLIIIKGQIKTPEIESCQNYDGNYKIVFRNVPSAYTYKEEKEELYQTSKPYLFSRPDHTAIGTFVF